MENEIGGTKHVYHAKLKCANRRLLVMNINNAYIYTLHRNSSRQYKVPHNVSSNFVFGQFEVFSIIIRFILLPICHNICFAPLLFYLESEYLEQRSFIPLLTKWIFRTKVLCSFTYKSEYIEQRPLLLYLQSAYISLKGPLPKYSLLILRSIVLTSLTASPRAFYPLFWARMAGIVMKSRTRSAMAAMTSSLSCVWSNGGCN